jgi:hypothetical protein
MRNITSRLREPVQREGAERYLRITLLSFAASVIVTRLYLELAGYPQVGGHTLHIAHVLWGGLLLFIAALLPLILANRGVYTIGALLSGIGVGLFIDEVGKFITQANDYFYPPAASIIYAFFLLVVLVYYRVRRPPSRSARAELYRALDGLSEVLDHDLDRHERARLEQDLRAVARQQDDPDLARLASALLDYLSSDSLRLAPDVPTLWRKLWVRARRWEQRWIKRPQLKAILVVGFVLAAIPDVVGVVLFLAPLLTQAVSPAHLVAPAIHAGLETLTGLPLLIAATLLLLGRDRAGIVLGYITLLASLTIVNLLIFYFDQFQAIAEALVQFALLHAAIHYRRYHLPPLPAA